MSPHLYSSEFYSFCRRKQTNAQRNFSNFSCSSHMVHPSAQFVPNSDILGCKMSKQQWKMPNILSSSPRLIFLPNHSCLNPHAQPHWANVSTRHCDIPPHCILETLLLMSVLVCSFNIVLIMSNTTMVIGPAFCSPPYIYNNYKSCVLRMCPPFTGT